MTTKLVSSVKKLWIDALRSGKYQQGTHALHNGDCNTFCCLGGLCDIHRVKVLKKGPKLWKTYASSWKTYLDSKDTPPDPVISWAFGCDGIISNPTIRIKDLPNEVKDIIEEAKLEDKVAGWRNKVSLAELNDSLLFSFDQIADVIEKCL